MGRKCLNCDGTGIDNHKDCPVCKGMGFFHKEYGTPQTMSHYKVGDIYTAATARFPMLHQLMIIGIDSLDDKIQWRWIHNYDGPDSFTSTLGDFNNLIEFYRVSKVEETTKDKILRLESELRELRKVLECEEMYAKVKKMNEKMTLGELRDFSAVLIAYIKEKSSP